MTYNIDYPQERFNNNLNVKKYIQELQGIAAAIIYDNKVDDDEIRMLIEWVFKHIDIIDTYPIDILYSILRKINGDGKVTPNDRNDIFSFLTSFAADHQKEPVVQEIYDKNCDVIFSDHSFMITGKLNYGQRSLIYKEIDDLGGIVCDKGSIYELDYLVVGSLGNDDWKYSRFGTKIEKVLNYRNQNNSSFPLIISEDQFINAMKIEKERIAAIPESEKLLLKQRNEALLSGGSHLVGKCFVLAGTLNKFTREEAEKFIELKGGKITNSITKFTNYLVLGNEPGTKYEKALKYKTPILNENDFEKILLL